MITLEKLSELVEAEFANDNSVLEEWQVKKGNLLPHLEQVPCSPWYKDEYGNEVQDYAEEEVNGCLDTYCEELAYFCWKCGCSLYWSQDWYSGNDEAAVYLPVTEEEYQNNLKEADNFWAEAGWDEYEE